MKYAFVVTAFAFLGAGPVLAEPQQQAGTVASKPDKVICKRIVDTGSLVSGARTCKTRAAWARDEEAAQRTVQEIRDASLINSTRPN